MFARSPAADKKRATHVVHEEHFVIADVVVLAVDGNSKLVPSGDFDLIV